MLLELIPKNAKTIAIIGMAKNVGKTETLNLLIEESKKAGKKIAIASIGIDGENTDLMFGHKKPEVYVYEGTLVVTSSNVLKLAEAKLEILEDFGIKSPLGNIILAEVKRSGSILLSGLNKMEDIKNVMQRVFPHIDGFYIDGAFDRRASAAPFISDAVILSTGAALHQNPLFVRKKTKELVEIFRIPVVKSERPLLEELSKENKVAVLYDDQVEFLNYQTAVNSGFEIGQHIKKEGATLLLNGALTEQLYRDILSGSAFDGLTIVVRDPTCIFLSPFSIKNVKRRIAIKTLYGVNLLAVSVNPYNPAARRYYGENFVKEIASDLYPLPVLDVVMKRCYNVG